LLNQVRRYDPPANTELIQYRLHIPINRPSRLQHYSSPKVRARCSVTFNHLLHDRRRRKRPSRATHATPNEYFSSYDEMKKALERLSQRGTLGDGTFFFTTQSPKTSGLGLSLPCACAIGDLCLKRTFSASEFEEGPQKIRVVLYCVTRRNTYRCSVRLSSIRSACRQVYCTAL